MTELGMILGNSYRGKRLAGHVGMLSSVYFPLLLLLEAYVSFTIALDRAPAPVCVLPAGRRDR
jgi:hypothetical protein